jgi:hypothetical protein
MHTLVRKDTRWIRRAVAGALTDQRAAASEHIFATILLFGVLGPLVASEN